MLPKPSLSLIFPFRYTSSYRQGKSSSESFAEALDTESYTTVDYERQFERIELTSPVPSEFSEQHNQRFSEDSSRFQFDHLASVSAEEVTQSSIAIDLDSIKDNSTSERNSSSYLNNAEVDNSKYQTNAEEIKIKSPNNNSVEETRNEVIGTGTKRAKYLQNPEEATVSTAADANDLNLGPEVWALAGMKSVDNSKSKVGVFYNITSEKNTKENITATSSTKLLADWTEIMKNNDFFNTSAIKNDISGSDSRPTKISDDLIEDTQVAEQKEVENKVIAVMVTAPPRQSSTPGKPSRFDEGLESTTEFDVLVSTEESLTQTEFFSYDFGQEVNTFVPELVQSPSSEDPVKDLTETSTEFDYFLPESVTTEKTSIKSNALKEPPYQSTIDPNTATELIPESNFIITQSPKLSTITTSRPSVETTKYSEPTTTVPSTIITTTTPVRTEEPSLTTFLIQTTTESDMIELPILQTTDSPVPPSTTTTTTPATTTTTPLPTTTTTLPPAPIIASTLSPEINSIERITETEIVESNNLPEYTVVDDSEKEKDRYQVTTQNSTVPETVHVEPLPIFTTTTTVSLGTTDEVITTTTDRPMDTNQVNGHQMFDPKQMPKQENNTDNVELGGVGQPQSDDGPDVNAIIAITVSVIGVVALVLLVGFLYVMRKRQKQLTYGQRCRPVGLDAYSLDNVSVYNSVRRKGNNLRLSKRSYGNSAFEDPVSII